MERLKTLCATVKDYVKEMYPSIPPMIMDMIYGVFRELRLFFAFYLSFVCLFALGSIIPDNLTMLLIGDGSSYFSTTEWISPLIVSGKLLEFTNIIWTMAEFVCLLILMFKFVGFNERGVGREVVSAISHICEIIFALFIVEIIFYNVTFFSFADIVLFGVIKFVVDVILKLIAKLKHYNTRYFSYM